MTNEVSCVKRHPHNLSIEREVHMSCYTQLTQEERYHISVLCKERFPKAEIARRLKRHPSTITRELRRNTGGRGYRGLNKHIKRHYVDVIQQRKRQNLRIKPSDW